MRRGPGVALAAVAWALAAAGCGPYPDVAQRLDVTQSIDGGDTWLAASGDELRVLVLGPSAGGTAAAFSYTAMRFPVGAGTSAFALQGEWTDAPAAGTASFRARRAYELPDERSTSLLARVGVTRDDVDLALTYAVTRSPDGLALAGDERMAGSYVLVRTALARLGATTERDAACAFHVANLTIRATEVRIIGFGGPGMTQYQTPASFAGTLGGTFRVSLEGYLDNTTTITYADAVELSGTRVSGDQLTHATSGGDGEMAGVLTFGLEPAAADGTLPAPIAGTIDFGGGGDPADAVQISNGTATGGHYVVTLAGGARARVSPADAPSPTIRDCLTLP